MLRGGRDESLNVRGAYLEVLADALGSVAVIVAAVVIATTGWTPADTVASVRHRLPDRAAGLAPAARGRSTSCWRRRPGASTWTTSARTSLGVAGVPRRPRPARLDHHLGLPVLSAHVVVDDEALAAGHGGQVLDALCACLGEHFDVEHCTFQLEAAAHAGHEAPVHD